jgi:hypothetical protein
MRFRKDPGIIIRTRDERIKVKFQANFLFTEVRVEEKGESLAAYMEYIALETREKDPARIQVAYLLGSMNRPLLPFQAPILDVKSPFFLVRLILKVL